MRNKPHRKGDRLIEFVIDSVFIALEVLLGFTDVLRNLADRVSGKSFRNEKIMSMFWGNGSEE